MNHLNEKELQAIDRVLETQPEISNTRAVALLAASTLSHLNRTDLLETADRFEAWINQK